MSLVVSDITIAMQILYKWSSGSASFTLNDFLYSTTSSTTDSTIPHILMLNNRKNASLHAMITETM
jgi:hypothetical protein